MIGEELRQWLYAIHPSRSPSPVYIPYTGPSTQSPDIFIYQDDDPEDVPRIAYPSIFDDSGDSDNSDNSDDSNDDDYEDIGDEDIGDENTGE